MDRGQSHSTQSYNGLSGSYLHERSATTNWPAGSSQSRFIDWLKPFFNTLRGAKRVGWNEECNQPFVAIKQYLTELLILASPEASNTLYLYLAVSEASVSVALFKEDEN